MPSVITNGLRLHYEMRGDGPAILGIHGTPSSALLWEDAAEQLATLGRCITYDRRGFHRSERPEPFESVNLSDQVDDAVGLLAALTAAPAVIIGRSTGGLIALELARRAPATVTALVLLEPALFTVDPEADEWARRLRTRVLEAAAADPAAAAEAVIREALGDEVWDAIPPALAELFASTSPAVLAEIRGRGLDLSDDPLELGTTELGRIDQPTLLVSAVDSPRVLRRINERLAERLPHAQSALVEGGHVINPASPVVLEFVSRHLGEPRRPT